MNLRDALLEALARTPEENAEFWFRAQRRKYDQWWEFEDKLNVCLRLGSAEEDELVEQVREKQRAIHHAQREIAEIRDRLLGGT